MGKYFSIKQVSEKTGLTSSNIRYYEKEGLIKKISRDNNGIRIFTIEEINWILFLKKLKDMEVPITKMKEYAYLREQGDSTISQRKELLKSHRKVVLDKIKLLRDRIKLLDSKIEYYQELEKKEKI